MLKFLLVSFSHAEGKPGPLLTHPLHDCGTVLIHARRSAPAWRGQACGESRSLFAIELGHVHMLWFVKIAGPLNNGVPESGERRMGAFSRPVARSSGSDTEAETG
jgi:hypothetical protein